MFRLVDVQSTTANVLKLGLTAAATVLTAILDDFLVPSRMAARRLIPLLRVIYR